MINAEAVMVISAIAIAIIGWMLFEVVTHGWEAERDRHDDQQRRRNQ